MLSPAATYAPVSGSRGGAAADRRTAGTPSRLTFRQRNVRGSAEAIARSARGRGRDVSARAIPEAIHNLTVLGSCGAFLQRLGISSVLARIIRGVSDTNLIAVNPGGGRTVIPSPRRVR